MAGISIKFIFFKPEAMRLPRPLAKIMCRVVAAKPRRESPIKGSTRCAPGAYQKIIEMAIPLKRVHNPEKQHFEVVIVVQKEGLEQERWPVDCRAANSLSQRPMSSSTTGLSTAFK